MHDNPEISTIDKFDYLASLLDRPAKQGGARANPK